MNPQTVPAPGEMPGLPPAELEEEGVHPDAQAAESVSTERAEHALEEQPGEKQDASWSTWDLGSSLAALRSSSEALQRRTLRMLHVRWFHASSFRMFSIMRAAGIPQKTLEMIAVIVDTCRVCRHWSRPGLNAVTSARLSLRFNEAIQIDLLFVSQQPLLHIIDEATR